MSFITITEFGGILRDGAVGIQAPMTPPVAEQHIDLGMLSVPSEPFKGTLIVIHSSVPIALAFGDNPEADPSLHVRSPGDLVYGVNPGQRLAVIMADE